MPRFSAPQMLAVCENLFLNPNAGERLAGYYEVNPSKDQIPAIMVGNPPDWYGCYGLEVNITAVPDNPNQNLGVSSKDYWTVTLTQRGFKLDATNQPILPPFLSHPNTIIQAINRFVGAFPHSSQRYTEGTQSSFPQATLVAAIDQITCPSVTVAGKPIYFFV